MTTNTTRHERARQVENDYFRRRDAELLERAAHATRRAALEQAHAVELNALSDALGVHDVLLVRALHDAGFRAGRTALLDWMPAIDVAWVDDLDMHERQALRLRIGADPRADEGLGLITEFLFVRPDEALLETVREVLKRQLAAADPATRLERLRDILGRCEEVGVASGGSWLVGAVSADERLRIAAIRSKLGDADTDILSASYEFPH